jgi:hypothetical protein
VKLSAKSYILFEVFMVKNFRPRRHQIFTLASLKLLMAKHPVAFCGGIWTVLLLVSAIAAQGIINPSFVKQQQTKVITASNVEPEVSKTVPPGNFEHESSKSISNSAVKHKHSSEIPLAIKERTIQTTPFSTNVEVPPNSSPAFTTAKPQPKEPPLWLYGGIFLAFVLGCILIFISFSYQPKRLQTIKISTKNLKTNQRQTNRKPRQKLPKQQSQQVSQPPRKRRIAKSPHVLQQPVVTVMPPEPNHAVNSGEESLADIMDLRKQQSLASLLGEKKFS